jgi:hypothetical protein
MKRVLALLVVGTVISGIAAYAATARNIPAARASAPR